MITPTFEEVKEAIKIRYAIDEGKAINMLRGQSSAASEVIMRLGLTRDIIRQAIGTLSQDRARQVVLRTIICTTRFKYYEGRKSFATTCLKCGSEDSFAHLVSCSGLTVPDPSGDTESMIDFLSELARRAMQINPGLPAPRRDAPRNDCRTSAAAQETAGYQSDEGQGVALEGDDMSLSGILSGLD